MEGLLRRLWTAAKEWRDERRDLRLLRIFLQSPSQRDKAMARATLETGLFMLTLVQFVGSELKTLEVRTNGLVMWCSFPGDMPAPASVFPKWKSLVESARRTMGEFTGPCFTFVTGEAPVSIIVALPDPCPMEPGDDLKAFLQKQAEKPGPCMTISKERPA
jgi:hypothetical protein